MNEMVERVARAIYGNIHSGPIPTPWSTVKSFGSEGVWHDLARDAIAAMREPTDAMIEVHISHVPDVAKSHMRKAHRQTWQAMIDEALK